MVGVVVVVVVLGVLVLVAVVAGVAVAGDPGDPGVPAVAAVAAVARDRHATLKTKLQDFVPSQIGPRRVAHLAWAHLILKGTVAGQMTFRAFFVELEVTSVKPCGTIELRARRQSLLDTFSLGFGPAGPRQTPPRRGGLVARERQGNSTRKRNRVC